MLGKCKHCGGATYLDEPDPRDPMRDEVCINCGRRVLKIVPFDLDLETDKVRRRGPVHGIGAERVRM